MGDKLILINGSFFKWIRAEKKKEIEDIAKIIGYDKKDIIKFEDNDENHLIIDRETMDVLASFFGIPSKYLIATLRENKFYMDTRQIAIDENALKAIRELRGLNQTELAEAVGYSSAYISKIESHKYTSKGKRTNVSKKFMNNIAKVLNISPVFLYPIELPISKMELLTDKLEITQFIDRVFWDSKSLRVSDILYLHEIMSLLELDEVFINDTIEKIKKKHTEEQKEIRKFIDRVFKKQSELRESDIFSIQSILRHIYTLEKKELITATETDAHKKAVKETTNKIEQITENIRKEHNNELFPDLTLGGRLTAFIKPITISYSEKVAQKVHQVQNEEHLHMIEMIVDHLNYLDQSQMNIINNICTSSESFSYKKHVNKTYPTEELLFNWVFTTLVPSFHREAQNIIFNKNFNITSTNKKKEYLNKIDSDWEMLLDNFKDILNVVIDHHAPQNQTIQNSILYWIYKTIIPGFLFTLKKEIDKVEINFDMNDKMRKEFMNRIKSRSSSVATKFSESIIELIKHFSSQLEIQYKDKE